MICIDIVELHGDFVYLFVSVSLSLSLSLSHSLLSPLREALGFVPLHSIENFISFR